MDLVEMNKSNMIQRFLSCRRLWNHPLDLCSFMQCCKVFLELLDSLFFNICETIIC